MVLQTPSGVPYVVGSDTVTGYPTTSLNLANKIETLFTMPCAALDYAGGSLPAGQNVLKGGTPTFLTGGITYNNVTGLFTVPRATNYLLTLQAKVTAPSSSWLLEFGGTILGWYYGTTILANAAAFYASTAIVVKLAANNTVSAVVTANQATITLTNASFGITAFTG